MRLHRLVPGEGGWDSGVGRPSSIYTNSRILIENPLACKVAESFIDNNNFTICGVGPNHLYEESQNDPFPWSFEFPPPPYRNAAFNLKIC